MVIVKSFISFQIPLKLATKAKEKSKIIQTPMIIIPVFKKFLRGVLGFL
ncbi:MAG: hypothetical protein LBO09_03490 [Candidatus Peribacteria bacterium]|jgi:hypothetical protein|nr:hypothetical protein [Candidatus Peribacteria bacterium]